MRSSRSRHRGSRNKTKSADVKNIENVDGVSDVIEEDAKPRIDTLIPYKAPTFRPRKKLGKLNFSNKPWTIASKLGTYLLSGVDEERKIEIAKEVAAYLSETSSDDIIVDDEMRNRILSDYIEDKNEYILLHSNTGLFFNLLIEPSKGLWHGQDTIFDLQTHKDISIYAVELPTAIGAMEILGLHSEDEWNQQREYNQYILRNLVNEQRRKSFWENTYGIQYRNQFNEAAARRWDDEINLEANRKYADHIADVFEDKKHCDEKHKTAARTGFIASQFKHVEIDDEVDLSIYSQMQDELEKRMNDNELPEIDTSLYSLRFRKTGRHRTYGVYCDALKSIAVDPRAPKAFLHEIANAYDYSNGQPSCSDDFRPILNSYKEFDKNHSIKQTADAEVPTEIFARAWEVYAAANGKGGSFVRTIDEMAQNPAYAPLLDNMQAINEYFSKLTGKKSNQQNG